MALNPPSYEATVLEWYVEQGVTELLEESPVNRFDTTSLYISEAPAVPHVAPSRAAKASAPAVSELPLGSVDARNEAIRLANAAGTLEELAVAIQNFEGLSLRKTASNMVFSAGNPQSSVMIIGEAPGADEDIQGQPFVGVSGQLLDKMLASIGLSRNAEDAASGVYISNVINWRPPGNRTPTPQEIDISLPFIERHIALAKPKILFLMGGISAKALLNSNETISKLRGKSHVFTSQYLDVAVSIPAIATYHPSYLLRTPLQKKAAWADLLLLRRAILDFNDK